ncbi:hypothetical protein LXA43DRAFT_1003331 [Ganoderma leucocontextum]|nr:hypothetical protein LXA43DRAFT_1003331 [Ganoderma leucocontextum]
MMEGLLEDGSSNKAYCTCVRTSEASLLPTSMAFNPGFDRTFGEPCFGVFNPFCTTSTPTSSQPATATPTNVNPRTTTTTVVVPISTTATPQSTSRDSDTPSPANPTSQPSRTPSQSSSSSSSGRGGTSSDLTTNSASSSSSSSGLGSGFITISQSVTATLTETSVRVTTTSAAPGVLGSQSSATPSRGTIIGVAVGGGISFLLVVIGAAILYKRMRRQESPAGHVPTFRSSQFVLNSSDSKGPLLPDGEEGRGLTAISPTPSSTLSPLRFAPLSPSQRSALSPALTASTWNSTQWHSTTTHSFALTSPAPFTAPSPTPSGPFSEPIFHHSRSPAPTSEDNHFSPWAVGTPIGYEEPEVNVREVDAGSVPPSVYRDLEGVYSSLQERAATEPLPPAYDTLPARRPVVRVRTDVP